MMPERNYLIWILNFQVYVLPETKMVLFVTDSEPIQIEKRRDQILAYLSRLTKYDVKLAKISPHLEQGVQQFHSTDLYLYAVNTHSNDIVDIDHLLKYASILFYFQKSFLKVINSFLYLFLQHLPRKLSLDRGSA